MLRHGCGYALANAGHDTRAIQDWLGHRSISTHRPLHRISADTVQGFLAGLSGAPVPTLLSGFADLRENLA